MNASRTPPPPAGGAQGQGQSQGRRPSAASPPFPARSAASAVVLSSPEQRTAEIVAVPKQPLLMTISDDYF